jgi:hypothetical protein
VDRLFERRTATRYLPDIEADGMRPHLRRKPTSFLKQDIVALLVVATYIALAFLLTQGWGFLSDKADAFATKLEQMNTP